MGFTLTNAADYKTANPKELLKLVVLDGLGLKNYHKPQFGVKYIGVIQREVNADIDPSDGNNTGYTLGSGGETLADVELWTQKVTGKESYDAATIDEKVIGLLKPGQAMGEAGSIPHKDVLLTTKAANIALWNEKFMVQADTSTTVQTAGSMMNKRDGLLAQIRGVAGAYTSRAPFSFNEAGCTDASILDFVDEYVKGVEVSFPQYNTKETILHMSPSQHSRYARAIFGTAGKIDKNTLNADGQVASEFFVPGTKIKAVSSIGFTTKNDLVWSPIENIIPVYDLTSEEDKLTFKFSEDADLWFLKYRYKIGIKVVDPSLCITNAVA